ncbi:hypothetical protein C0J52_23155, partial [Blattella germanica]
FSFTSFNNHSLFSVIHISCQIKSLTRNTVLIELIIITGQTNVHFSDSTNYLVRLLTGIRLTYRYHSRCSDKSNNRIF